MKKAVAHTSASVHCASWSWESCAVLHNWPAIQATKMHRQELWVSDTQTITRSKF